MLQPIEWSPWCILQFFIASWKFSWSYHVFNLELITTFYLFLHESLNVLWAKANMTTTEWVLCCNFQLRAQLDKFNELWQWHPNEDLGIVSRAVLHTGDENERKGNGNGNCSRSFFLFNAPFQVQIIRNVKNASFLTFFYKPFQFCLSFHSQWDFKVFGFILITAQFLFSEDTVTFH